MNKQTASTPGMRGMPLRTPGLPGLPLLARPLLAGFALSVVAAATAAPVDTSAWKCETCPFDKPGTTATVEAGAGYVTDAYKRHGDFTGLDKKGGFLVLGGSVRHRNDDGYYVNGVASDLGLDVRSLEVESGREGRFRARLGYSEIPRSGGDGARSPFLGLGGTVLTLPAGYPATSTATMPLAGTLQAAEWKSTRSRLDAGLSWNLSPAWTTSLVMRHDVKDGTQRYAGSFFSTSSQLLAPLDQVTDQLEASLSYGSGPLQATVAYQVSLFRNSADSLTWQNPFSSPQGATRGQLALAPDNEFQQVWASASYEITPNLRASGDIAFGQMTQDEAFLAATTNTNLVVPALPAASLNGKVDTFNASLKLAARLSDQWRLQASYARDARDNRTASLAYPSLSTDMFLNAGTRSNQPFGFAQDRWRVAADWRGALGPVKGLKASAGVDEDDRMRTLQEVVKTRETTLWAKASAPVLDLASVSLKLAHGSRSSSTYGIAAWVQPAENPLLRKFNLAERRRDAATLRADFTLAEEVTLGIFGEWSSDDYRQSTIGLQSGLTQSAGADLGAAIDDNTQVHAFLQTDRMRSRQAGSQVAGAADWWASNKDVVDLVGLGIRHRALKGKLELSADFVSSRTRSQVAVDVVTQDPAFPRARAAQDSMRLQASWKMKDNLTWVAGIWYERLASSDWHLDGVRADTLTNLLALGEAAPHYSATTLRLAARYTF